MAFYFSTKQHITICADHGDDPFFRYNLTYIHVVAKTMSTPMQTEDLTYCWERPLNPFSSAVP